MHAVRPATCGFALPTCTPFPARRARARGAQLVARAENNSDTLLEQLESLINSKRAIALEHAELSRGVGLLRAERELLLNQLNGEAPAGVSTTDLLVGLCGC
jgi:hypothetical protein